VRCPAAPRFEWLAITRYCILGWLVAAGFLRLEEGSMLDAWTFSGVDGWAPIGSPLSWERLREANRVAVERATTPPGACWQPSVLCPCQEGVSL
jgi:hypothetical protein